MFNNFVKSMMALCMVTSGWSSNGSNGVGGLLKTSEHKQENNENSIVQYKVINITLGENGTINERKECEDSDINTSNSSEESIKTVDEETQTDEEGSVDRSDLDSSNSSGEATEAAVTRRQANYSWDARTIDSNQLGTAEEIKACEEVSDKVYRLNFLTGQYEKSKFYTPEEAKMEAKVIKVLRDIQPNLEKVYNCDDKNVTFSNLLLALNESRHIWKDSEDLNDFKKIVINLANGEVDSKQFKDNQVLEAIWDMMSRRDYGYDY